MSPRVMRMLNFSDRHSVEGPPLVAIVTCMYNKQLFAFVARDISQEGNPSTAAPPPHLYLYN